MQKESRWGRRERENNSAGGIAFTVPPGNSAEQLQSLILPFLNLQWSGCFCLITGRALCKRWQGTHLQTSLHAGENSHLLGEGGKPRQSSTMDRYWQGSNGIQEHQASWANSGPTAHDFPVKQTDGWMHGWCV